MCLFVFQLSFVKNNVCEVFDDILVDILHEGFDGLFLDFKVGEFVDGVFVYGFSDSDCDGDEWVSFISVVLYGVYYWVVFNVFVCDGLVG